MTNGKLKQPIVTVAGHVDHGKTSILDCLRGSSVQAGEAGGITQKISFTSYPISQLKEDFPIIKKSGIELKIPGFLFIDTPGHAAFTNLRKRGGSLSDISVLVMDINEGIKPQTSEVLQILKHGKVPFIIALNKIDNVSGWKSHAKEEIGLKKSIESQRENTKSLFDEKCLMIIGSLSNMGFESDLFYNISDFTKKIAIIPCSAKTKEGIPELVMVLCGLSQKYLGEKLVLGKEAKGVILEIKKEKSINYANAILHDGTLKRNDEIAVSNLEGKPINAKVRVLEEIEPLSFKFKPKMEVEASTGIRMQFSEKMDLLPGMPFVIYKKNDKEIEQMFKREISSSIKTQKQGIIAKADSLGSLEALMYMLDQSNIPVVKAGIGSITKADVISAKANLKINELDALIVGFNVSMDEDALTLIEENSKIKIITEEVVYKLIDETAKFRDEKRKEIEKSRMMELSTLCKLEILHQYVFRNTSPAIFGIRVATGKLISGTILVDEKSEKVGRVKNIQSEKTSVLEAGEGMEVAISLPGVNFERVLGDRKFLYSEISESQFRNFEKNKDLLSSREISLLEEIASIKRSYSGKADWGL